MKQQPLKLGNYGLNYGYIPASIYTDCYFISWSTVTSYLQGLNYSKLWSIVIAYIYYIAIHMNTETLQGCYMQGLSYTAYC